MISSKTGIASAHLKVNKIINHPNKNNNIINHNNILNNNIESRKENNFIQNIKNKIIITKKNNNQTKIPNNNKY